MATAINSTRAAIIRILDMQSPTVVSVHPAKQNMYYVAEKSDSSKSFTPIIRNLSLQRSKLGKTIIFCRTYDQVTTIYYYFKQKLGVGLTDPPGAPDIMEFRLVDMYTHCTHKSVNDYIKKNFKEESPLRVVIAFGMGIDCPNIRQIIHWGVPSDMETFIQETGRAGWDGELSCSLMLYSKTDLNRKRTTEQLIEYCKNEDKQCAKKVIFADFDNVTSCLCCWICKEKCTCGQCESNFVVSIL